MRNVCMFVGVCSVLAASDSRARTEPPAAAPVEQVSAAEPVAEKGKERISDIAEIRRDVNYAPDAPANLAGAERQRLDLYVPKRDPSAAAADAKSAKPFPVVVWVHGGGWSMGDKRPCPVAPLLVKEGFAVVSVNYRFTDSAPFPAQIEDVKAAVRWVRASAAKHNLDPDRIGAWGASAGGHLVAHLGTSAGIAEVEGASLGNKDQSSRVQAVGEKRELARQASPVTYVSEDDAPFLIMQGDKDPLVPTIQSQRLEKALKEAGVKVELVIVKGAGHGFAGKEHGERVRDFFVRELKPPNS